MTTITEELSTTDLLELSFLYYNAIAELADVFDVSLTPATRARAFQILSDLGDDLGMRTLAAAVLAEVESNNEQ